ncbi:MAG: NADH-quinone oxidoreductase subunit NuoE [Eubacteriaceae bacterium]|jgi:NADH-quinone oxidoreductase subunit E|nr:NADH-quinone oxidoreductase subunit NuoE [Eubacteriaceae bacterium]
MKKIQEIIETCGKSEGNLISILQKIQEEEGYISVATMDTVSQILEIPVAKIYGVVTFYSQFRLKPVGKYLIMLCQGTACHVNGSAGIEETITEYLKIKDGETTADGLFTLENVACLGCCSLSPAMMISGETYGELNDKKVIKILKSYQQ